LNTSITTWLVQACQPEPKHLGSINMIEPAKTLSWRTRIHRDIEGLPDYLSERLGRAGVIQAGEMWYSFYDG
jgi:hypothetical protein